MGRRDSGTGTIGAVAILFALAILGPFAFRWVGAASTQSLLSEEEITDGLFGAHDVFLDDVMLAGYSPDGLARDLGAFPSFAPGDSGDRVQFIADLDSDGTSDLVTYEVRGGSLVRTVESRNGDRWEKISSDTLADGVVGFHLRFLGADGTELPADAVAARASAARAVRLSLELAGMALDDPVERLTGEMPLRNVAA
jgi:hypothetical protein